jgi:ArsR family transcriptional regulator
MHKLVKISKALSDETRIRMLKLLLDEDICACEMRKIFPLSLPQLSRNLKMLMEAGFLKCWRDGKCLVYIADRDSADDYCRTLMDLLSASYNNSETVLKDRMKLKQVKANRVRVCC